MEDNSTLNQFTPVSLVGVLARQVPPVGNPGVEFKLVTPSGVEYSILTNQEWRLVLENHIWEEVRVRGLLNALTMTIVPQWVVPCGPAGETQKTLAELVLAPV